MPDVQLPLRMPTRLRRFAGWLFEGRSSDPVDRATEPLIRVAMVTGVVSSILGLWINWLIAGDRVLVAQYAIRSAPIQFVGLCVSLVVLQRIGVAAAARVFGGFVIITMSLTSVVLGAELISNSLPRLILPTIVLAVALRPAESAIWMLCLTAAAWVGLALDPFRALSTQAQQAVVGRLATATLVFATSHLILVVFRRALRREIAAASGSAAQLARSQRVSSLGRLAAGTAHDFNGLLGAILLTTEEIGSARSDAERDEAVGAVKDLIRQSTELTKRLLQFARGSTEGDDEYFDLRESVDEALDAVRPTFGWRITVTQDDAVMMPTLVRGSRVELRQIFTNLLMNAGDAIQGEGTVDIRIDLHGPERDRAVRVVVRDSGPGVDRSVRESLFEPFVSTKGLEKGTGLGLSTSQAIAERHGGTLVLDAAAPPPGATFVVTLPLARVPFTLQSAVA